MSEYVAEEHNRLFQEALAIIEGQISLNEQPEMPMPGWLLGRRLRRAIALFEGALKINPRNWSAMWFIGKVHQRLGNKAEALTWFERSYHLNPRHPDIAREASLCAMEIGSHDAAIVFARRAAEIPPTSPGIQANLALAYLLAGRVSDAEETINLALTADSSDTVSQTVRTMVQHFLMNGRVPPSTTSALLSYWRRHR